MGFSVRDSELHNIRVPKELQMKIKEDFPFAKGKLHNIRVQKELQKKI